MRSCPFTPHTCTMAIALSRDAVLNTLQRSLDDALRQLLDIDKDALKLDGCQAESIDLSALLQATDEVSSVMALSIRRVSEIYNISGPRINRLPWEVLCAVFAHLAPGELIDVTHVCRYWRAVALDDANLWSDIATSNLDYCRAMVDRSKAVGLHVNLQPHRNLRSPSASSFATLEYDESLVSILSEAFDRVRALHISRYVHPSSLERMLAAPAPALMRFSMQSLPMTISHSNELFSGVAPSLRHVSIYTMPLSIMLGWRDLLSLDCKASTDDNIDTEVEARLLRIPRVSILWSTSRAAGLFGQSLPIKISNPVLARLLPPMHDLRDLQVLAESMRDSFDGSISSVQKTNGFRRRVLGVGLRDTIPWVVQAISTSRETLTILELSEEAYLRIPHNTDLRVRSLTLRLRSAPRHISQPGALFDPQRPGLYMPSLERLTLESHRTTFDPTSSFRRRSIVPCSIPAPGLVALIKATSARPALVLRRVELLSGADTRESSLQSVLDAVGSVDWGETSPEVIPFDPAENGDIF